VSEQHKTGPLVPDVGHYVLATKYSDGDPGDAWALGFYAGTDKGPGEPRHIVLDAAGQCIRPNGFRRVGRIHTKVGTWLLANAQLLEFAPSKINLWGMYDWDWLNESIQNEEVAVPDAVRAALAQATGAKP
jgi:hypothetical protein